MKPFSSTYPRRQQGSILVQFALLTLVLLAVLGTVQVGYMYSAKRDLQRIADIAALESANAMKVATTCNDAKLAGKKSIEAQWPPGVRATLAKIDMVDCGRWSKMEGFSSTGPFNAARVTLSGQSLQLIPFTGNTTLVATSTAAIASDPLASFTLGSGVARLDAGALNTVLTMLLGTSVNLSLVDYEGLANTNINLLGITNALQINAGNYSELLNAKVSLNDLLSASIEVAKKLPDQPTAKIAIDALDKLISLPVAVALEDTSIHLLKNGDQNGLLDLGIYRDNSATALNADVSALSLLKTALQIANADSAAALQTTVDLGVLAKATVTAKVIEPPVIATGPAGQDDSGQFITTAHTGQVRLQLDLRAVNSLTASGDLLDINLVLLRLRVSLPSKSAVRLPVYVEVGSADGRLESVSCHHYGANSHKVSIGAKPGISYLLLGSAPDAMTNTSIPWSRLPKDYFNLLDLNLKATLLADLFTIVEAPIKLMAKLDLPVDESQKPEDYQRLDFQYSTEKPRAEQQLIQAVGSENQLGSYLGSSLNKNLLQFQLDTSGLTFFGIETKHLSAIIDGLINRISTIVSALLPLVSKLLTPIFSLLDSILGPVLKALGLQIGYADVELLWADCNPAQLVN